ncbi:MAG TPA: ATP-binding cassette domain-containing protein [Gammaproteobacteria bacterium]
MLAFSGLALRRASTLLFEDASFKVFAGQKLGITGANGCGKSSLFALISGELGADQGEFSMPDDWAVSAVEQETRASDRVALEYVIDGDAELRQTQSRLERAERDHDSTQIAYCHERLQEIDGYQASSRAARLLAGLGFDDAEIRRPLNSFSGGWIMRLNLARALMCRSDLLLLDEPTNHLDLDAVIWLEQWLQRYQGCLLLISHDRDFLDAVVDSIAHIENQRISLYKGNYSAFELQRAERLSQQQAAYEKQQQSIAHMQRYIDRFRAKATKAKQAQSRIKALERMQLIAPAHVDSPFHFEFREPEALPSSLLRLQQVSTGYGERVVLDGLEFSLIPGERIGLLGLNGAGKSTFIKLLADELQPFTGEITRARHLRIGYFAQHQVEQLDLDASPLLILQRLAAELSERQVRSFLGGFNFRADKVLQPTGSFSGGEKARLVLALLLWQRPNLLLLDEPTNHLDLEMRLALNQALQGFRGSVILVSHDRHLLRSVCDDLWLIDGGRLRPFEDDLDAYPAWLARRKAGGAGGGEPTGGRRKREFKAQRNRISKLEREIEQLTEVREGLLARLGEDSIYLEEHRDELRTALAAQAENQQRLEHAEEDWLRLSEALEAQQD